jgi:hypothetical protein
LTKASTLRVETPCTYHRPLEFDAADADRTPSGMVSQVADRLESYHIIRRRPNSPLKRVRYPPGLMDDRQTRMSVGSTLEERRSGPHDPDNEDAGILI